MRPIYNRASRWEYGRRGRAADAWPEQTMNIGPRRLILRLWKSVKGLDERHSMKQRPSGPCLGGGASAAASAATVG
jgi:hypothetical protein